MTVKLLSEHHLEFLSLKGGGRGSSESTLVKMSNCWKSHAAAHILCKVSNEPLHSMMCKIPQFSNHFPMENSIFKHISMKVFRKGAVENEKGHCKKHAKLHR